MLFPTKNEKHTTIQTKFGDPRHVKPCFRGVATEGKFGVEIELFFVNQRSGQPVPLFQQVFDLLPNNLKKQIREETAECQIEFVTKPHRFIQDIRDEILQFLKLAGEAAAKFGAELSWQAMLTDWEFDPKMLRNYERTRLMYERLGDEIAKLVTCSMHIHVEVSQDQAISLCDALTSWVPVFVSLSANSPEFNNGKLVKHSRRATQFAYGFPNSDFPRVFGNWDGYESHLAQLMQAGVVQSPKDLYNLVRLSPQHSTVEVRACDLPNSPETAVNIAAFAQALAVKIQQDETFRIPIPNLHADLIHACRDGLNAKLTGLDGRRQPLKGVFREVCEHLRPIAEEFQSTTQLERLERRVENADAIIVPRNWEKLQTPKSRPTFATWQTAAIFLAGCLAGWVSF